MKITVLAHLEGRSSSKYDVVVDHAAEALTNSGHDVSIFSLYGGIEKLVRGLRRRRPDLIFNLMETFGDGELGAVGLAGVLDLLGYPYTGGGPAELALGEDKVLTKKLLAYEKIRYPDFAVFPLDADFETGGNLRPPFFVKPLRMDGSWGIDAKLVRTVPELLKKVTAIHQTVKDAALAEEYVHGRELYVGVLGNRNPQALPPVEMDFSGLPDGALPVLDVQAKWDENSARYRGTRAVLAELPDELRARLQEVAVQAYRALRVRDYGRIDLRLTETGDIYVIEVNASCYLEKSSEFVMAAGAMGMDYPTLLNKIVECAMERAPQTSRNGRAKPRVTKRRAKANGRAKRSAKTS